MLDFDASCLSLRPHGPLPASSKCKLSRGRASHVRWRGLRGVREIISGPVSCSSQTARFAGTQVRMSPAEATQTVEHMLRPNDDTHVERIGEAKAHWELERSAMQQRIKHLESTNSRLEREISNLKLGVSEIQADSGSAALSASRLRSSDDGDELSYLRKIVQAQRNTINSLTHELQEVGACFLTMNGVFISTRSVTAGSAKYLNPNSTSLVHSRIMLADFISLFQAQKLLIEASLDMDEARHSATKNSISVGSRNDEQAKVLLSQSLPGDNTLLTANGVTMKVELVNGSLNESIHYNNERSSVLVTKTQAEPNPSDVKSTAVSYVTNILPDRKNAHRLKIDHTVTGG